MSGNRPTQTAVAFGPFEATLQTQELKKDGMRLRLPGQSFKILKMLLERRGELVTREELQEALWSADTNVDYEHGVNAAVNRLREALGDSADSPQIIETLPRRGYRFIGRIDVPPEPTGNAEDHHNRLKIALWILVGAACTLALVLVYLRFRPRADLAALAPVPFTAYPGIEIHPTFSPDGTQIAFAWNGDPAAGSKGFDLYIKVIGSEKLLRLTQHPSEWLHPAWSPDGAQIAFHRGGLDSGLYLIPALGGPERKLRATQVSYEPAGSISWSADGQWIAFTDADSTGLARLNLLSTNTLESKRVPHEPKCIAEGFPAFSSTDNQLAYVCLYDYGAYGLYRTDANGSPPRLITTFTGWPFGITWEHGMERIILSRDRTSAGNGGELNEVTLADGTLQRLPFGEDGIAPALSRKGDKLAYTRNSANVNIWRKDLFHPHAPAVKLISSTREQTNPQYSPDGKHVAFESTRNGDREIWMTDADGTNSVQVTHFGAALTGTPRWAPDSQRIAFDSRSAGKAELYIVDISELVPRKVVTNTLEASVPSWSRDGKWIYFTSGPADGTRLYRCPANGGTASRLSKSEALGALESVDGEMVVFANRKESSILNAVLLKRPSEQFTLEGIPRVKDASLWTLVAKGIYLVPTDSPRSIGYFDFGSKQVRRLIEVNKDLRSSIGGLSVSPDGRWIIYSQLDEQSGDIMLVDHFH
jgi:Tol biopolymer transport system component/DNA-binding winged helix-turn-helix (wHTH) protein